LRIFHSTFLKVERYESRREKAFRCDIKYAERKSLFVSNFIHNARSEKKIENGANKSDTKPRLKAQKILSSHFKHLDFIKEFFSLLLLFKKNSLLKSII
jgi:hypothetical protein